MAAFPAASGSSSAAHTRFVALEKNSSLCRVPPSESNWPAIVDAAARSSPLWAIAKRKISRSQSSICRSRQTRRLTVVVTLFGRQPIEREIEAEHVHAWLTQQTKHAPFDAALHQ